MSVSFAEFRGSTFRTGQTRTSTVLVTYCGRICIFKKKINLGTSLARVKPRASKRSMTVLGSLGQLKDYDLAYIDREEKTPQPLHNTFGPKV